MLLKKVRPSEKERLFFISSLLELKLGFLELINNMLTSGIVPALYTDEERAGISESVSRRRRIPLRNDFVCFPLDS